MPEHTIQMRGFNPPVLELKDDERGDTYRCCVTVRLKHRVYVLHVFKKKSTKKDETPVNEIRTIRQRLQRAVEMDAEIERAAQEARHGI